MMSSYTQTDRLLSLTTPLGADALLLTNFSGREEMSRLFTFQLQTVSEEDVIKPLDLLGAPVTVAVRMPNDEERYFNGCISRFNYLGKNDRLNVYTAEMVPWLWFLTRTHDCRIFQNKTVPQIIAQIFKDLNFTDFDQSNIKQTHPAWDYCVQYRETDFNFVSRLMEHEGIFYFFKHENGKHTLIMSDQKGAYEDAPENQVTFAANVGAPDRDDVITSWEHRYQYGSGKYSQTDYNFETPSANLMTRANSVVQLNNLPKYDIYDYPGDYDNKGLGDAMTGVRMEEAESTYEIVSGSSKCRTFSPGLKFKLTEHHNPDEENKAYVLTAVEHTATMAGSYVSGTGSAGISDYNNTFECIPDSVAFRPARITPKSTLHGAQTAVVVGPAGQEIYTDKYGRVKVQFFWDREGQKNEKSSCWVRVSQPWAGKNWGAVFNPRIGQEVIVSFLEGDPDQPLITGRVYNAEMMPPYSLPDNQTQTGIKSRSSKGGSPSNFNEIRMEDKMGSEELYFHAEKDHNIVVEHDKTESIGHDQTETVGHDKTETVGNNETITIQNNRTETVVANETLTVLKNRTRVVAMNETITVALMRTHTVGVNETITVGAAQEVTVGAGQTITVGADQATTVGANQANTIASSQTNTVGGDQSTSVGASQTNTIGTDQADNVGGARTTAVTNDDALSVGKKLVISAGDEISITTGDASIVMKKDGTITISGKDITINGSGEIDVKASKNITMKGQKILQN
jgi:type VI secretion system secreted protein VgrG